MKIQNSSSSPPISRKIFKMWIFSPTLAAVKQKGGGKFWICWKVQVIFSSHRGQAGASNLKGVESFLDKRFTYRCCTAWEDGIIVDNQFFQIGFWNNLTYLYCFCVIIYEQLCKKSLEMRSPFQILRSTIPCPFSVEFFFLIKSSRILSIKPTQREHLWSRPW